MAKPSASTPTRRFLLECSGACGDLGTFVPHVIGAMTIAGLAPARVLFGFATFLIATGLFYGLPLPVQPMKAISAVILTGALRPGEVAAAGIMIGVVLLVLGITGWIGRLARAIPQSVGAGLQLGLGLLMGMLGIKSILETPWLGFGSLALLFALMRIPQCPAVPIALDAAMGVVVCAFQGKIGAEREKTVALDRRDHPRSLFLAALQLKLGSLNRAQAFLPFAFKATRHQPVVRVDSAIAALGALRFVIGSLDPEPPLLQPHFAFGFQPLSGGKSSGKPGRLQSSDEDPGDGLVDLDAANIEAIDTAVLDENLARGEALRPR
jgi:Molybdate transporter of MFS superfamily